MAGTAVIEPQATPRVSMSSTVGLALALLVALAFWLIAAAPYLAGVNEQQFGPYWPRRYWMLAHIAGGSLALFIGPVQLWLGVSRRLLPLHRMLGMTYIAAIAVSVTAAYYLAFTSTGPWVFALGLAGLATAWVITTGLAFVAIKRRAIQQHQEWMIRSCVVTFGFVAFRAFFVALMGLGIGTMAEQQSAAAWFCWSVPLMVTEVVLQGRRVLALPPAR